MRRPPWLALLLSPVGLLLLSVFRLIVISRFNTTTAIAVATSGGYVNTIVGSVIPLVPVFIPYVALLLLLSRHFVLSAIAFLVAVFITPTSLRFPATLAVARSDTNQLLAQLSDNKILTVAIAILIGLAVWAVTDSLVEAVSSLAVTAVAIALLIAAITAPAGFPGYLHGAESRESRLVAFTQSNLTIVLTVVITFGFVTVLIASTGLGGIANLVVTSVAAFATVALFPYIYNLYPVPRHSNYYADMVRTPWLPAQEIRLNSGLVYTGYVLSTSDFWFVVLLDNTRRIAYIPEHNVTSRTICQPASSGPAELSAPLIPLFYTRSAQIAECSTRDVFPARTSVLSTGESLYRISSLVRVTPAQIISVTNAYYYHHVPLALQTYERSGNWNGPTPVGLRFWYYPPANP